MRSLILIALTALSLAAGCKSADKPAPAKAADDPSAAAPSAAPAAEHPGLKDPAQAKESAPATYTVKLETTKGDLLIDVTKEWSPNGADRFYNLVKIGYYNDVAFFRVIPGFMAQVGISGSPAVNAVWREARFPDDPVKQSNLRGYVTFATAGPNSRTTQFFLNLSDNANLDRMGFSSFGKLRAESLAVLDSLHGGYGEGAPRGRGPSQGRVQTEGNTYLRESFPELDYIKTATIVPQ